jgi:hypothetical protein
MAREVARKVAREVGRVVVKREDTASKARKVIESETDN